MSSSDQTTNDNGANDNKGSLAPLSQVWQLTNSSQQVRFEMPDMLAFADGAFDIPNRMQADIYNLIYGNGTFNDAVAQLNYDKGKMRGLYALFAIICVEPKFTLDDEDRKDDELGPRNVSWIDITAAYNFFRFGPVRSLPVTTNKDTQLVAPTTDVTTTD